MAAGVDPELRRAKTVLFNTYLAPVTREFEFVRDSRIYRRFNEHGDCVLVEIQPSTMARFGVASYDFYVWLAVVPRPMLEYDVFRGRRVDFDKPNQMLGISERLRMSEPVGWPDLWRIDSVDSAHRVGAVLVDTLRPWLAELERMLDRDYLVDRMTADVKYPFGFGRESMLAVLLAERGMGGRLAALLDQFDEWHRNRALGDDEPEDTPPTPSPFADWIRARVAAQ